MIFGKLHLTFTDQFNLRWNDKGSGANKDGAYWHPVPPKNFNSLGSVGVSNYNDINSENAAMCVKAIDGSSDAIANPIDYVLIWTDKGSGADKDGSCWRPKPPTGYVALGDVFVGGYNKPSLQDVVCVKAELAYVAKIGDTIWEDKGSGAKKDFGSYKIITPESYLNSEKGLFTPNTFVGNDKHSKPSGAPVLFCLNLPFPVIKNPEPSQPTLTSTTPPPSVTGQTIDRIVYVPFTAIEDKERRLSWKVKNSPFYMVERQISYRVELFGYNQTSGEQTITETIKTGVSKTQSESFSVNTGISVTSEAGVSFFGIGGKVSATVSVEMGWQSSTGITQFQERSIEKSIIVPPNKAMALWATGYSLMVRRSDNSFLPHQMAFEVDYFVHDEYPN